jgi:hypothetical protein
MFENAKARFAKLEEDHESIRKVKTHVEKYQTVYAVVGASGLTLVAVKLFGKPQVIVKGASELPAIAINNMPVFENHNIGNQQTFGGPMTKLVKCLETGEVWETVTEAAEAAGASLSLMSRHLNGYKDHVYDKHYKIIGLGTAD